MWPGEVRVGYRENKLKGSFKEVPKQHDMEYAN